jgi:thiamine transporter ThiT
MPWHNVACFLGGMFLANFFPHFIAGMSGVRFYTPFATPPFRGLSSPVVNMLYALFNLAVAYVLLVVVGSLELRSAPHAAVSAAGFALWSVQIARAVTKLRGSSSP